MARRMAVKRAQIGGGGDGEPEGGGNFMAAPIVTLSFSYQTKRGTDSARANVKNIVNSACEQDSREMRLHMRCSALRHGKAYQKATRNRFEKLWPIPAFETAAV